MAWGTALLALLAVDVLAVVSPGPAFVMISQLAVRHGRRTALVAVVGLTVAVWFWCAAVLCGLAVLFRLFPWLYGALKIAGGAYLIYLGIKFWRAPPGNLAHPFPGAVSSALGGFRKGLLVGLTNPKAVVYFGSIFTLFIKPGSPLGLQAAAVAIATCDTLVWYGLVGAMFSRPAIRGVYGRIGRTIGRAAGVAMTTFGVKLLLSED
jgi:threonine efflux protein